MRENILAVDHGVVQGEVYLSFLSPHLFVWDGLGPFIISKHHVGLTS